MGTSLEIRQKAIPWKRVNDDVVAPTSGKPKRAQNPHWLEPFFHGEKGTANQKPEKV